MKYVLPALSLALIILPATACAKCSAPPSSANAAANVGRAARHSSRSSARKSSFAKTSAPRRCRRFPPATGPPWEHHRLPSGSQQSGSGRRSAKDRRAAQPIRTADDPFGSRLVRTIEPGAPRANAVADVAADEHHDALSAAARDADAFKRRRARVNDGAVAVGSGMMMHGRGMGGPPPNGPPPGGPPPNGAPPQP